MDLTLCYAPMACSLVAYVNLTEAGAPFAVRTVNTGAREQKSAEYLAVNPKGKVPVLLVDGYPLTENVAIQQFIARSFPAAKLLPAGLDEFKAISLMSWFTSTIHPHLTPNARPENYCDMPEAFDGVKRVAQKLLSAFEKPLELNDGQEVVISPSIGISIYPRDGTTPEALLKHADAAMYRVKEAGKNRYQYYSF